MKRRISLLFILFISVAALTACQQTKAAKESEMVAEKQFFAMNTYISLTAYGSEAEAALSGAEEQIRELEDLWSVTEEQSEIYRLNHHQENSMTVSTETADLISYALDMAKQTDGALGPTIYPVLCEWGFTTKEHNVPSAEEIERILEYVGYEKVVLYGTEIEMPEGVQLDMGAVAKGYIGDLVIQRMKEQGISSAMLSLGGNIQVIGTKPDGSLWRVGLRDPFGQSSFGILEVSDCAVITSGGYQNNFTDEAGNVYHHIIDPATGKPAENGLASVTVTGKEGRMCDALSTALFVMGTEKATLYWQEHGDFEMVLVDTDGGVYITEGIEKQFSLTEEYASAPFQVIGR